MTVSTHVYSAVLVGTPNIPLAVRGGSITLDDGSYPHVQASLEIAVPGSWSTSGGVTTWSPNLAAWLALDPRQTKRVIITATSSLHPTRTFNLGLRRRRVNQSNATISLTLASDEMLLSDYSPAADDESAFALQSSLRGVINYALGKAIPGAELNASPAHDADVTAYWAVTNLIANPGFELNLDGWINGANATSHVRSAGAVRTGAWALRWLSSAPGWSYVDYGPVGVTQGRSYAFGAWVISTVTRPSRVRIHFQDALGFTIAYRDGPVENVTDTWSRRTHVVEAPPGAVTATLHVGFEASVASQEVFVDDVIFHEGKRLVSEFSGATPTGGGYTYTWSAGAHASASTRVPDIERDPDSLVWRAGMSGMDFLRPLFQASGLRLVNDETRGWTLRDETYTAPGSLSIRHGVNLVDGDDTISRDSSLWYDAAVARYTWTDPNGIPQERIDSYALNTPYSRLELFEIDSAYPGAGFAEYAVRRAQGRGRELNLTTVSDWTARSEQAITAVLEGAPTQIGKTSRVTFDLDLDEMSITTRTVDTPNGAVDLLTGSINSKTGTVNNLTT